jgi:Rha family phage regulatory protein
MNELTLIKRGDTAYIDSRKVAEAIGKPHKNLIRDIRGYIAIIENSNQLNFEPVDFFVESKYRDNKGEARICYLISKLGCELCAHKLIGEKGVLFTAAYVQKFNAMEAAEREAAIQANSKPRLSDFNGAIKNVLGVMSDAYISPDSVMGFLRDIYKPLGIHVAEDGYTPCFYTVTDIAEVNGIYSESGRPHAHAVAAIITKLNIHKSHIVAVPYGLVGVTYRYTIDVISAVGEWLAKNGFPREIPYLNFNYHVYYDRKKAGTINNGCYINLSDPVFTEDELDAMCVNYDDCDECPGREVCCGED